ncbi:MAG: dephospho-CoA kinase [Clostridiales bacterium]|nr:dephospho-CoA kinase [Clostridiales bacterium]
MSRYVIGLTGGIACGKSHLTKTLRDAGARIVDADEISRGLTAAGGEALPAIRAAFGETVFRGETLDRRALGAMVFADEKARKRLNDILHPMIFEEMRRQIGEADGPVVMDVPLLYETGLDAWCDEIWCAYVPVKEQISRLRSRDGLTCREARDRVRAQMPARGKARRADRVIRTDRSREESAAEALRLWQGILANSSPEGENAH